MNTGGLAHNGLGNQYYTAATRSIAGSWRNWFFAAFDSGGFISVDKPPLPLWVTAIVVRIFGVSTWSVILPSALAGVAAVAMLWIVVHRHFGVVAATISALVLAVSPNNVAVNRLNLPAFAAAVLLGVTTWRRRIGHGAVLAASVAVLSFPWILIVDAIRRRRDRMSAEAGTTRSWISYSATTASVGSRATASEAAASVGAQLVAPGA